MSPTPARRAKPSNESQTETRDRSLLDAWDSGDLPDDIAPRAIVADQPNDPVLPPVRDLEPDPTPNEPGAPPMPDPPPVDPEAPTPPADEEAALPPPANLEPATAPTQPGAPPVPAPPAAAEIETVRRQVTPPMPPKPSAAAAPVDDDLDPSFEELGLSGALLRSIRDVGYEEPTPIQLKTIPVMLAGQDAIAQAQTGSGKTAAFGLPIIEKIDSRNRQVQALILCPTRELAIQVAEALHKYGRHKEVETLPIYGGQPYEQQFRGLQRGVHIVVGTPGRVMDHMRRGTLSLDAVRVFVLDEADEMLDMGFVEDIEWILEQAPDERQMALFSATIPPRIAELSKRYLRDPARITIAGRQMTVPETRQSFYEVPRARKVDALTRLLDAETPSLTMIFCRTKIGVDELGEALMARGYAVETLHGDLSQMQRDRVMRRFRGGQADVLIATDVAARGLDVPDVSHVINYDVPESAEAYVHRIGRTGRAGKAGDAITLVAPREVRWLRQIERIVRARIEPRRLPTAADVAERRQEAMKQQIRDILKNEETYARYLDAVADLAEEHDATEVAAAILKLYADETGLGASADLKDDDVASLVAASGRGETGMVRLFLNVGRNQGVRPQDIVGAIANEANIPGRSIGAIDIFDAYAFVDIPSDVVERVLQALAISTIKGRRVNAEVAQPDAGRPAGQPRDRDQTRRGGRGPAGPRRDLRVGGGRVDRGGESPTDGSRKGPRPPAGRRYDRVGPTKFRQRRDDRPKRTDAP